MERVGSATICSSYSGSNIGSDKSSQTTTGGSTSVLDSIASPTTSTSGPSPPCSQWTKEQLSAAITVFPQLLEVEAELHLAAPLDQRLVRAAGGEQLEAAPHRRRDAEPGRLLRSLEQLVGDEYGDLLRRCIHDVQYASIDAGMQYGMISGPGGRSACRRAEWPGCGARGAPAASAARAGRRRSPPSAWSTGSAPPISRR